MNVLARNKQRAIEVGLLTPGLTLRKIARLLKISPQTARRYKNKLVPDGISFLAKCVCGRKFGHRGWCAFRFSKSRVRQRFMKNWHNQERA